MKLFCSLLLTAASASILAQAPAHEDQGSEASNPVQIIASHASTGTPVVDAQVLAGYEVLQPTWGESWWRAKATTDANGAAQLPPSTEDASYNRIVVVAPGLGTKLINYSSKNTSPIEVTLPPAVPLEIELVFDDGAPAARVHVGVAFGCGHTPDVFSAVSDYRGFVTIPNVSPQDGYDNFDLYPIGEGISFRTLEYQRPWEAGVRQRIVVARGKAVRGQVFGFDGEPAVGIFAGQRELHRGPWAKTDASGRFTLYGIDPNSDYLEFRDANDGWLGGRDYAGRGLDVRVHLWDELGGADPPLLFPITVDLSGSPDLTAIESVAIEFWSPYTGLKTEAYPNDDGLLETKIEEGWYMVEIGDKGGPVKPAHAGAVYVGPPDASTQPRNHVTAEVAPIQEREIVIESQVPLSVWRLETPHGTSRYRHFKRTSSDPSAEKAQHLSKIDSRWLPFGRWTIAVNLRDDETDGWYDTEVVSDDGTTLTLRLN